MIITHPDQPLEDLAVPLRVALVATRDELDGRVDQTQRVGPTGGLFGVVGGREVADLPRSVHCQGDFRVQRSYKSISSASTGDRLTLVTETPELDIMRLVPSRMLSPQISPAAHHTNVTQGESVSASTSTFEETPERSSFRLRPEPEPEPAFSPDPAEQPGADKRALLNVDLLGVTLPVAIFQQTERFFERSRSHVQTQVPITPKTRFQSNQLPNLR
jgi:hypothetical protein